MVRETASPPTGDGLLSTFPSPRATPPRHRGDCGSPRISYSLSLRNRPRQTVKLLAGPHYSLSVARQQDKYPAPNRFFN